MKKINEETLQIELQQRLLKIEEALTRIEGKMVSIHSCNLILLDHFELINDPAPAFRKILAMN